MQWRLFLSVRISGWSGLVVEAMDLDTERLLASFRGLPAPDHVVRPHTMRGLDGLVGHLLDRYRIEEPKLEDTIRDNWGIIIGARFMNSCEPAKLFGEDNLLIRVANPMVRQELEFMKRGILENLQSVPGCEGIQRIAFR
jgi:hypothetical protein